jgi:hypothetical protein
MSLINTQIKPFKATAFHNGKFVDRHRPDLKGKWSVRVLPGRLHLRLPDRTGRPGRPPRAQFKEMGVEIYGVSTDTHFAHKAWHDTSDTIKKIKYPMIGDPTGTHHPQLRRDDRRRRPGAARHLRDQPRRPDQAVRNPRQRHRP